MIYTKYVQNDKTGLCFCPKFWHKFQKALDKDNISKENYTFYNLLKYNLNDLKKNVYFSN